MENNQSSFHFVCSREEAWQIVEDREEYWVSNCGCREKKGHCTRSRIDLCLDFEKRSSSGGSGMHKATREEVKKIFDEAQEKHLVTRPFRDEADMKKIGGICFCCDDCCEYFTNPEEKCDKGAYIENTNMDDCTHCGECVDVCYFNARNIVGDELAIDRGNCFGCGLCRNICPTECVTLVERNTEQDI